MSLKFLSRVANQAQHVVANSPVAHSPKKASQRILGEASPLASKTPIASPSRTTRTPIGSPLRCSPFFEDFDRVAKKTAEMAVSAAASPHFAQQKDFHSTGLLAEAAVQKAAASAAAQQELAASALPAAELARQSFLAKRRGNTSSNAEPAEASTVGGFRPGGLLGRGEDASTVPARKPAVPDLPVLLGQDPPAAAKAAHFACAGSERETAELVRQAFLERRARIAGRGAVKKVP